MSLGINIERILIYNMMSHVTPDIAKSKKYGTPQSCESSNARFKTPRSSDVSLSRTSAMRQHLLFKSPMRSECTSESSVTREQLQEEMTRLREKEKVLDEEIKQLTMLGYQESELKDHMNMMHDYNEIKDVGQMIFGKIAHSEGVTTRDLYQQYNLSLDD